MSIKCDLQLPVIKLGTAAKNLPTFRSLADVKTNPGARLVVPYVISKSNTVLISRVTWLATSPLTINGTVKIRPIAPNKLTFVISVIQTNPQQIILKIGGERLNKFFFPCILYTNKVSSVTQTHCTSVLPAYPLRIYEACHYFVAGIVKLVPFSRAIQS